MDSESQWQKNLKFRDWEMDFKRYHIKKTKTW